MIVAGLLGAAGARRVLGPVNVSDLAIVAIYLTLALAINAGAALVVRHKSRPTGMAPSSGPAFRHRAFAALGRPLYILIWIYGLYFAATPILMELRPEQGLADVRQTLDVLFDVGGFFVVFWLLVRASFVLETHLAAWAAATPSKIDDLLVPLAGTSVRIVVIVVGIILGIPVLGLPPQAANLLNKLTSILLIGATAALLIRAIGICQNVVLMRFDISAEDNLRARKVYTQIHVFSRVLYVLVVVFAVAAILMLFPEVRHVGTSLLASAGVLGVIAGLAAQKTLANLFAGFQIALAQPVRQDDVVVVEGEWGRVEEITLTYIVVHIWDDRRLVLPLSYFIEKPFQNWTRTSAELLGSVFVWVDYAFPVDEAREALRQIVEGTTLWDRRFWNLQVSDATEHTMQLRILVTASNSSRSWDLRCEIREKFIAYVQRHHPEALPRLRATLLEGRAPRTAPLDGRAPRTAPLDGQAPRAAAGIEAAAPSADLGAAPAASRPSNTPSSA
jgi:small-conductance mechanosensitive channel